MNGSAETAAWFVGMVAALGAFGMLCRWMWVGGRWVYRALGRVDDVMGLLLGEPPGPDGTGGRPGIDARQRQSEESIAELAELVRGLGSRVEYVEAQLRPNGGQSLRDKVDVIAASVPPAILPTDPTAHPMGA